MLSHRVWLLLVSATRVSHGAIYRVHYNNTRVPYPHICIMSIHTAKRQKLTETDPPNIKKDLCNCLRNIDSDKSPASVLNDHKQKLDKVLARWSKPDRESEFHTDRVCEKLIYVLESEYSEANIGLEHFTGKDKLRTRYLLEASKPGLLPLLRAA